MKVITILTCALAGCQAVQVDAGSQAAPAQMMMDMMYMQFWSGTTMSFLFKNASSDNALTFIIGLAVCFVGAVVFEILNHFKSKMNKNAIIGQA